jgi:alpha-L-fucosidase
MRWFREARFGMFIHWGVYAVPAGVYEGKPVGGIGEWIMNRGKIPVAKYKAFAPQFTASKYDPDAWAALAHGAGMRYVVITSKHHDGFANFATKASDWNAVQAGGAHRDLIAPLAEAVRKQGMKFGLYYSQAQDWTNPGGAKAGFKEGESWDEANKGSFDEYLKNVAVPQVREILTQYRPDILWWDTPVWMTRERADLFGPLLKEVPGIVTNNRLGGGYGGDTETPEQRIPATGGERDFEVCMTMNDTWGYKSDDHNWKSTKDLVRKLVDIASKGGNFLLNVGPTAEGEIPPASVERLQEIGAWMKVNGESIHGTTASPFFRLPWGRATKKVREDGATVYLQVFDWPKDGKLVVPGLRSAPASVTMLASGEKLQARREGEEDVVIDVPAAAPDAIASVIKVEISGKLDAEAITLKQGADGVVVLPAGMAEMNQAGYANHFAVGGDKPEEVGAIHSWTTVKEWVQWTFKVEKPGTYRVVAEVSGEGETGFRMDLNKEQQQVKVGLPGSFEKYGEVELGSVVVKEAGVQTLSIRPTEKAWKPMNVRWVKLVPGPK